MSGTTHATNQTIAKPKLRYLSDVLDKRACLVLATDVEISGFGICHPDDASLIVDQIIPPQQNDSISTKFDTSDVLKEALARGFAPENIVEWWHSHGLGQVFFSSQDIKQALELDGDFQWSTVYNHEACHKILDRQPLGPKDVYVRLDIHQRGIHTTIGEWMEWGVKGQADHTVNKAWAKAMVDTQSTILSEKVYKQTAVIPIKHAEYWGGYGGHISRGGQFTEPFWTTDELDTGLIDMSWLKWAAKQEKLGLPKGVVAYKVYLAEQDKRRKALKSKSSHRTTVGVEHAPFKSSHRTTTQLPAYYLRYVYQMARNLASEPPPKWFREDWPTVIELFYGGIIGGGTMDALIEMTRNNSKVSRAKVFQRARAGGRHVQAKDKSTKNVLNMIPPDTRTSVTCHWMGGWWFQSSTGRKVFPDPDRNMVTVLWSTADCYTKTLEFITANIEDPTGPLSPETDNNDVVRAIFADFSLDFTAEDEDEENAQPNQVKATDTVDLEPDESVEIEDTGS